MCSSDVAPEAVEALASLLDDFRHALAPDDPESVVIGPVDFGCARLADPELPTGSPRAGRPFLYARDAS